jgi:hypothetical protein
VGDYWIIFCIFLSIKLFFPKLERTDEEKRLINEKIKPAITFIKDFKQTENRLPTKREFFLWEKSYYNDLTIDVDDTINTAIINYSNRPDEVPIQFKDKLNNVDWTKYYFLEVWNGESFEYYFSWSDTYYNDNHERMYNFINAIIWLILGFTPIFFWYRNFKQSSA